VRVGQFTVLPPGAVSINTTVWEPGVGKLTVKGLGGVVFHACPPLGDHSYDPEPPEALSVKETTCPADDCDWLVALIAVQERATDAAVTV
jgi:hypothetical protein